MALVKSLTYNSNLCKNEKLGQNRNIWAGVKKFCGENCQAKEPKLWVQKWKVQDTRREFN